MKEKFISIIEEYKTDLYGCFFRVEEQIAEKFIEGKDRRIICTVNDLVVMHCALMPSDDGWFILINKTNRNKIKVEEGDRVEVVIEKEKSKYGMPMPVELETCLTEDKEGSALFHKLTMGKQRSLIYIVSKIKSSDIKIRRSLAILHHLQEVGGKLDFKLLNETIKDFNQRENLKR